jgi:hypothetical protein
VKREKILATLKWVWFTGVLLAAGWYLATRYQEIAAYLGTLSFGRLALSALSLLGGKFLVADITRLTLKKVDHPVGFFEALTITYVTQLGKYLPGGIWHFAGKFGVYRLNGLSAKKSTQALVLETVWLFSASGAAGISLLAASSGEFACQLARFLCDRGVLMAIAIGLPLAWVAGLWLFEWLFFGRRGVPAGDFLRVIAELAAIWLLFGVSYWLVFPAGSGFLTQITGAFSLGWLAGYAAFFAPGGIGVRELLLAVLLSAFFSPGEVAIYATVHRLLWVLAEILLGAGSALVFGMPGKSPGAGSSLSNSGEI